MFSSKEMIEHWEDKVLPTLLFQDFRGDSQRMAYSAYLEGCFFGTFHATWHDAESDDLPPYDKEVIVLIGKYAPFYTVCFGHRPDPAGWDGKDLDTGEIKHYQAKTYGKGGWNIYGVKWWLDIELPKMEEEE